MLFKSSPNQIFKILQNSQKTKNTASDHNLKKKVFGSDFQIIKDHFGKPFIQSGNTLYPYSRSHSDTYTFTAFSKNPAQLIGVDIETIKNRDLSFRVKFMSNQELQMFNQLRDKEEESLYFYMIFSQKEALGKAMGVGLSEEIRYLNLCATKIDFKLVYESKLFSYKSHFFQFKMILTKTHILTLCYSL